MAAIAKLNFGCGSIQPADWTNVDIEDFGQEYVGSTELFADDTFDMIVAHCALQINTTEQYVPLLVELRRILKPDGVLRISLPDIARGFKAYTFGDIGWFPNGEGNVDERFSNWLTWYSTSRTLLTPVALFHRLEEAEFRGFRLVAFGETGLSEPSITVLDTREGECYFMEARK